MRMALRAAETSTSVAPAIHRSRRSPLSSALVASRSNRAWGTRGTAQWIEISLRDGSAPIGRPRGSHGGACSERRRTLPAAGCRHGCCCGRGVAGRCGCRRRRLPRAVRCRLLKCALAATTPLPAPRSSSGGQPGRRSHRRRQACSARRTARRTAHATALLRSSCRRSRRWRFHAVHAAAANAIAATPCGRALQSLCACRPAAAARSAARRRCCCCLHRAPRRPVAMPHAGRGAASRQRLAARQAPQAGGLHHASGARTPRRPPIAPWHHPVACAPEPPAPPAPWAPRRPPSQSSSWP